MEMPPSPEALALFGSELRRRRGPRTRPSVVAALKRRLPDLKLTAAAMGHWETGANAPGSPEIVWELEDELGVTSGTLARLLNWGPRPRQQQLDHIERRGAELRAQSAAIADEFRRLAEEAERLGNEPDE